MIKLQLNPPPKMLGQFAWIAPIGFLLVAFALRRVFGLPETAMWCVVALGPLTLVAHLLGIRAVPLAIWRVLVTTTWPIGLVVLPTILGLVYYGVFTPIGLLFRLVGRDGLHRRIDRSKSSYWIARGPARPSGSYFKLY